ncbi:hypothetical protein CON50_00695 [Bacillus anthracis]|nr:hypothetical protein CON50_00695 [Bacillus anthracis]
MSSEPKNIIFNFTRIVYEFELQLDQYTELLFKLILDKNTDQLRGLRDFITMVLDSENPNQEDAVMSFACSTHSTTLNIFNNSSLQGFTLVNPNGFKIKRENNKYFIEIYNGIQLQMSLIRPKPTDLLRELNYTDLFNIKRIYISKKHNKWHIYGISTIGPHCYERKSENQYTQRSKKGLLLRSKNEKFISDVLEANNIPYEYEARLIRLDGWAIYPDFILEDKADETIIIWEHLGLTNCQNYMGKWNLKNKGYKDNLIEENSERVKLGLLTTTRELNNDFSSEKAQNHLTSLFNFTSQQFLDKNYIDSSSHEEYYEEDKIFIREIRGVEYYFDSASDDYILLKREKLSDDSMRIELDGYEVVVEWKNDKSESTNADIDTETPEVLKLNKLLNEVNALGEWKYKLIKVHYNYKNGWRTIRLELLHKENLTPEEIQTLNDEFEKCFLDYAWSSESTNYYGQSVDFEFI